jgi:hypothetical protein
MEYTWSELRMPVKPEHDQTVARRQSSCNALLQTVKLLSVLSAAILDTHYRLASLYCVCFTLWIPLDRILELTIVTEVSSDLPPKCFRLHNGLLLANSSSYCSQCNGRHPWTIGFKHQVKRLHDCNHQLHSPTVFICVEKALFTNTLCSKPSFTL